MKTLVLVLLCLSLASGYLARLADRKMASGDYDEILRYVEHVEKAGFQADEFKNFASDRVVMRKTIYLGSPLGYFLYIAALSFLATALGTVAFAWKGKASTEKK